MQLSKFTDDPLAARLFEVLVRLVKRSQHEAMALTAEYDLTLTQLRLLHLLDQAGEALPVGSLAESIGLSVAATGRAVDALHRAELVTRAEDSADRRVKRIALSGRGATAVEEITRARFGAVTGFVSELSAEERTALSGAVEALAVLTDQHLPPLPGTCAVPAATEPPSPSQTSEVPA